VAVRRRLTAQRPSRSRVAAAFSACHRPPTSGKLACDRAASPPSASHRPATMQGGRDRRLPVVATAAAFVGGASAMGL